MMTRTLAAGTTLALLLIGVGPHAAQAQTSVWTDYVCSETSFNPCVEFELVYNGEESNGNNGTSYLYSFIVRYVSVKTDFTNGKDGYMTAAGLYDYDGGGNWSFEDVTLVVPNSTNWSDGSDGDCQQLSGGGNVLFEGCVATTDGINSGVPLGGYIQFDFKSDKMIAEADFISPLYAEGADLGARVMIQGVGDPEDCSFKLDSPQGFVSGCDGPVVPEPATVILLATGLIGVGAVGYRKRRKEEEV